MTTWSKSEDFNWNFSICIMSRVCCVCGDVFNIFYMCMYCLFWLDLSQRTVQVQWNQIKCGQRNCVGNEKIYAFWKQNNRLHVLGRFTCLQQRIGCKFISTKNIQIYIWRDTSNKSSRRQSKRKYFCLSKSPATTTKKYIIIIIVPKEFKATEFFFYLFSNLA